MAKDDQRRPRTTLTEEQRAKLSSILEAEHARGNSAYDLSDRVGIHRETLLSAMCGEEIFPTTASAIGNWLTAEALRGERR